MPFSSLAERTFPLVLSGLFATHLLRNFIVTRNWLTLPLKKGLSRLSLAVLLAGIVAGSIRMALLVLSTRMITAHHPPTLSVLFILLDIINYYLILIPWAILYFSWYQIGKRRRENLDRQRLEVRVEAMQQQAETSGVDLDSLIDTLAHIQSSIDENPSRCRAEITEFSNLLRKGFLIS